MATDMISALGAGSGVDVKALAQSLVDAEKIPREATINTKIDDEERRIAGLSALMLSLDIVKEQFAKLNDATDFNSAVVNNSRPEGITVTPSETASPGNHTLQVKQLASAQRTVSDGFATASTQLNAGQAFSLKLTIGGVEQAPIRISDSRATPGGLVGAINSAKIGVTAQLVDTGDATNPFRVVLTGEMGAAQSFTMESDDASGSGQVQSLTFSDAVVDGEIEVAGVSVSVEAGELAVDIAAKVTLALSNDAFITGVPGRSVVDNGDGSIALGYAASDGNKLDTTFLDADATGVTMSVTQTTAFVAGAALSSVAFDTDLQSATDAIVSVNGLDITRNSNEISDALQGTTLVLHTPMSASDVADVQITRDTAAIKANIQALVQSYNDAVSDIKVLTGERSEVEDDIYSGSLKGESTVRRVTTMLRDMLMSTSSTPGESVGAMRDLGLDIDRYGVLSLDEEKLDGALATNFADVVTMFSAGTNKQTEYGTSKRGLAGDAIKSINDLISSRGIIMAQSNSAENSIDSAKEKLEALNLRMEALLARYTKQFGLMESLVGQSNSQREGLKSTFEGMMAMYTNN